MEEVINMNEILFEIIKDPVFASGISMSVGVVATFIGVISMQMWINYPTEEKSSFILAMTGLFLMLNGFPIIWGGEPFFIGLIYVVILSIIAFFVFFIFSSK